MIRHRLDVYDVDLVLVTSKKQRKQLKKAFPGARKVAIWPAHGSTTCLLDMRTTRDVWVVYVNAGHEIHREPGQLVNTCAHEATHVATGMLRGYGEALDGEAVAYLVGWLAA